MQEIYLNAKIPDEWLLNLKCFWAFAKNLDIYLVSRRKEECTL